MTNDGTRQTMGRRTALPTGAGLALGGAALAAGAHQADAQAQQPDVVGAWITYVRIGQTTDIHMMTLAPGGILLFSSEAPRIPGPPILGLQEFWWNDGHGAWRLAADGSVEGHFVVVIQERNQFARHLAHVRPRLRLQDPDTLTGQATFETVPIGATAPITMNTGMIEATRVRV